MNAAKQEVVNDATSRVTGCAYRICNSLGAGFLEKVYENAMAIELRRSQIPFKQQPSFLVRYREEVVGESIPDFVVAESIVVELKALDFLNRIHQAQCMNYLRATRLNVALLLNFGASRLELKRLVWNF